MSVNPPTVFAGDVILAVRCPACGVRVTFPATIAARLAIDSEHRLLRPQLLAKSTDHRCGESGPPQLPFRGAADEDKDKGPDAGVVDMGEGAALGDDDDPEWDGGDDFTPPVGRRVDDVELPEDVHS
jgi:hypothetical protein